MIAVQMPLSALLPYTQLFEDLRGLRHTDDVVGAVHRHQIRFPATVHTTPVITLEANHTQDTVIAIITTCRHAGALMVG
jgi:hypothetical protein